MHRYSGTGASLIAHTSDIVIAYVSNNSVDVDDGAALICSVHNGNVKPNAPLAF